LRRWGGWLPIREGSALLSEPDASAATDAAHAHRLRVPARHAAQRHKRVRGVGVRDVRHLPIQHGLKPLRRFGHGINRAGR
jgi:hypothetical protein